MHKTNEIISGTRTHPPTSQGITPSSYPRMWFIVKPFPSCRARQHTHILSKPTVLVLQPAEHNAEQISGQSYPNATVEHLTRFVCSHCSRINKNLGTHLSINSMCPFLTYFLSFFLSYVLSYSLPYCYVPHTTDNNKNSVFLFWNGIVIHGTNAVSRGGGNGSRG